MADRRVFLKTSTMAIAGTFLLRGTAWPFTQSPTGVTKFLATLPALGLGGANNLGNYITVLSPNKTKYPGTDYYEIVAKQFTQQLHPSIPPTTFWGYADAASKDTKYLGGVIVAKSGTPVKLKIANRLPAAHILPVDPTAVDPSMAAEVGGRVDRIAVHLHGGLVQWTSDGGPFAWFSNPENGGFIHGSSFLNGAGPGSAIYDYPNDQSARFLWYHDHAYGITRLNAYAGLATGYLITDEAETIMVKSGLLPDLGGAFPLGIPLVIQDKTFWDGPGGNDPAYADVVSGAKVGSAWYPHIYEGPPLPTMAIPPLADGIGRWDNPGVPTPPISLIPEFYSDTMLVNGAPYPKLPVAPRRYRFRLLNGSQARVYNLQLYVADSSADGITLKPSATETDPNNIPLQIATNPPGPRMIQIGTEGGILPAPVVLGSVPLGYFRSNTPGDPKDGNVNRYNLLLAPAERADVIVDFRGFEGRSVILYNDASAPFPGGDIRNDYYPGGPDFTSVGGAPSPAPGQGPDTRILMRFEVSTSGAVRELTFNQTLDGLKVALPLAFASTQPLFPPPVSNLHPKQKTLNEGFDNYGRLIQKLGVTADGTDYLSIPTEIASHGEVQTWQIFNLTGDTHPMHFHLVNVAVVKREAWRFESDGSPVLPLTPIPGTARPPDPNERGWKETVRMNPGEVVTVTMKFDLPKGAPAPASPRLKASYGITGAEYVWHCHILEHEEHDMMHALVVT